MKYNRTKKIIIDCTLDSSEAIMFNKGGKHSIKMDSDFFKFTKYHRSYDSDGEEDDFADNCEVEITFQIDKKDTSRFDFITGEACKHKERVKEEENETKQT